MESSPAAPEENTTMVPSSSNSKNPNRLSLSWPMRSSITILGSFTVGLGLGISHGMQTSSLRFRAENAHRFPTSSTGWYFYHKSKNYNAMLGGIKEGLKMGSKVAFWAGGFFVVEEAVDRFRGRKDFLSTLIAGVSIAGGFSFWSRFPPITVARTAKIGVYSGIGFGLIQDAVSLARGKRLAYMEIIQGENHQGQEPENKII